MYLSLISIALPSINIGIGGWVEIHNQFHTECVNPQPVPY